MQLVCNASKEATADSDARRVGAVVPADSMPLTGPTDVVVFIIIFFYIYIMIYKFITSTIALVDQF